VPSIGNQDHYDDDVRQVELEVQTAYSNLQQNRELIKSQGKNVEQPRSLRLAKARLDAGAGVQLDVLNAQVQCSRHNRRVGRPSSDTTRHWRIRPRDGRAEHLPGDVRRSCAAATKSRRMITSSGVDAEENERKADDSTRELRLEDPERHIPNKAQIEFKPAGRNFLGLRLDPLRI